MTEPVFSWSALLGALTGSLDGGQWLLFTVCAAGAVWLGSILWQLGRAERRQRALRRHDPHAEAGTATIEFALVVPILLFLIFILTQTTLVMGGNLFVHYAAFAATRTAVVVIPRDAFDEPANMVAAVPNTLKFETIRYSAVMALIPVSGRDRFGGNAPGSEIADGLDEHYTAFGQSTPRWVDTLIADRADYADANTDILVLRTIIEPDGTLTYEDKAEDVLPFGPAEAVTVRVAHRLNLPVPVVWPIFADDDADGRFATVEAQYTLTNEGTIDQLPPAPALPRQEL